MWMLELCPLMTMYEQQLAGFVLVAQKHINISVFVFVLTFDLDFLLLHKDGLFLIMLLLFAFFLLGIIQVFFLYLQPQKSLEFAASSQ